MTAGPARTSKEELEGRGSWLAKKRGETLKTKVGTPKMPTTLTKEAAAEWKRIVPALAQQGALAETDRAALVVLCESWSEYRTLQAEVRAMKDFTMEKRRLMSGQHEAYQRWQQMATRFGLTPADRTRVPVGNKSSGQSEGKARFFDKPRLASG